MRHVNKFKKRLLFCTVLFFVFSCTKDAQEDLAPDLTGDHYYTEGSRADQSTIDVPSVVLGYLNPDFSEAFHKRLTNLKGIIEQQTRVVVVPVEFLDKFSNELLSIYHSNGIIVITEPIASIVNEWFQQHGIESHMSEGGDPLSIFAFNHYNRYSQEYPDDDYSIDDHMGPFVSWVKYALNPVLKYPLTGVDVNITDLIRAQSISKTFNISYKAQETKVIFSSPDIIEGNGSLTVRYEIYPLYAFTGHNSSGDYYIVTASITANNADMYRGRYIARHGGVWARLCGFYMTELNLESRLSSKGSAVAHTWDVGTFPLNYTPTPKTTENSTSYNNGFSWNLGANLAVGADAKGPNGAITVNGGVSFSNSESRTISDVDILNNSVNNRAVFRYKVNNLPRMSGLTITDPPSIAISNAEFLQSWIWRVPETRDTSKVEFYLNYSTSVKYGSCHFFSTGADFKKNENHQPLKEFHSEKIIAPNRTPTGRLIISNTNNEEYISDVTITKKDSLAPWDKSTGSIAFGKDFSKYYPEGDYKVEFKMGKKSTSVKTYTLTDPTISIKRGVDLQLNSAFDFIEKK